MGRHKPGHDALPVKAWPQLDQDAWAAACIPGDPFEPGGIAARWRPATREARIGAYGRFLGSLDRSLWHAPEVSARDLVTPVTMGTYLRLLRARGTATQSIAGGVLHLHGILVALWPEHDWRWLAAIRNREWRLAEPKHNKLARIVPQRDLVMLGLDLMVSAEEPGLVGPAGIGELLPALRYRDGLMVALLALRPLRRRNFLHLAIGESLQRTPEGWDIVLSGEVTKNHTPLRQPVPTMLLPMLERYLEAFRPALTAQFVPGRGKPAYQAPVQALWLSRWGSPLTTGGIQYSIESATRARFGQHVNVHLFRDCAATSLADEHPEHMKVAADLLGHRSFATTQKYYIASGQRRALNTVQTTILQHRKGRRSRQAPEGTEMWYPSDESRTWRRS